MIVFPLNLLAEEKMINGISISVATKSPSDYQPYCQSRNKLDNLTAKTNHLVRNTLHSPPYTKFVFSWSGDFMYILDKEKAHGEKSN